ncbi:hypothetical protein [Herbaspirillum sp. B65]|jgi:hypothetical protein|uniref:hypothetical protein n=1 Tax=Herbaspirillum sp. B65 TaxID=137708 RepID=UPI0011D27E39|nr:hypothetical protein [Herbaspirillum sp. B65]
MSGPQAGCILLCFYSTFSSDLLTIVVIVHQCRVADAFLRRHPDNSRLFDSDSLKCPHHRHLNTPDHAFAATVAGSGFAEMATVASTASQHGFRNPLKSILAAGIYI